MIKKKKNASKTSAFGLVFTHSLQHDESLTGYPVRLPSINSTVTMATAAPPMHYSVPPRTPFAEDPGAPCASPFCLSANRRYHVYGGTTSDYSGRITSRQSSPAKVIGIDGQNVNPATKTTTQTGRGSQGFFPRVKLRNQSDSTSSNGKTRSQSGSEGGLPKATSSRASPFLFELAPQPKPNADLRRRKRPFPPSTQHQEAPSTDLIHQKLILAPKSNPWVYRYKVKKSLNELNRILSGSVTQSSDFPTL
ncbi:hypothetical protein CAPTEDRAFT_218906 [Capitella teleta]|uniref:Uncharacterized protein n=1 Tax=Capitella teleta TaxID=283909 RepID=R7VJI1_CAPTE|nr:hypothetical protein CAPTEDRAFT_218906 [Capitella teleta]|eukprot:ELU16531.1 hypothetical protein CAPTEDRAFT_218906 [Capitella teleta]